MLFTWTGISSAFLTVTLISTTLFAQPDVHAIADKVGFAITIVSIALATSLFGRLGLNVAWVLLPGPVLGLIGVYPLWGNVYRRPSATENG